MSGLITDTRITKLLDKYYVVDLDDNLMDIPQEEIDEYGGQLQCVLYEVEWLLDGRYLDTGTYTGIDVQEALKVKKETKNFKEIPLIFEENFHVKDKYSQSQINYYKELLTDLDNLKKLYKALQKLA